MPINMELITTKFETAWAIPKRAGSGRIFGKLGLSIVNQFRTFRKAKNTRIMRLLLNFEL